MGDRGNIIVKEGSDVVYLYSHWSGSSLRDILKEALRNGKDRWEDYQYLTRIIFCEMIKDDIDGLTGYGISSQIHDSGTELYVDVDKQTVDTIPFEGFIKKVKK